MPDTEKIDPSPDNEEWDQFVDSSPQGCLFCKSWWLDAVAPCRFRFLVVRRGGRIAAGMPLVLFGQGRNSKIGMPKHTQTLGILFRTSEAKYTKQIAEQVALTNELLDRLPPHSSFQQRFNIAFTNWLPLFWRGYNQTTRYTYIIEDLSDLDAVWNGFLQNIRASIKKAQRNAFTIRDDLTIDDFYRTYRFAFERGGTAIPHSIEHLQRIDRACRERDAIRTIFALDEYGSIAAVNLTVWDGRSAYYLMGGIDPAFANSGVGSMLMWDAIRHAATTSGRFDFEGSMMQRLEKFFRSFGGRQVPYFQINRTPSLRIALGEMWSDCRRRLIHRIRRRD